MKYILLTVLITFFSSYLPGQHTKALLEGTVRSPKYRVLYLFSFYGTTKQPVDTAKIDEKGKFRFNKSYTLPGFFRLQFSDTNYVDLILTAKEKTVIESGPDLKSSVRIIASEENKLLWYFKDNRKRFFEMAGNVVNPDSLNKAMLKDVYDVIRKNNHTFFALTSATYFPPVPTVNDLSKYNDDPLLYYSEHYFDNTDFSKEEILNSTVLPNMYMKYLKEYVEYDEQGFKKAVDLIMAKASASQAVYDFSLAFLMELFDRVGPELIFEYISENYYLKDGCGPAVKDSSLKNQLEDYKRLQAGNIAPEISLTDTSGRQVHLSSVLKKNKVVLIFFWSSHCGFCISEHPELQRLYDLYRGHEFEIYSVSLDETATEWKSFIKQNKVKWITVTDLKGWRSPAVGAYKVNKTPTFYLLDGKGKIIRKNPGIDKLEPLIKQLLQD